MQVDFPLGQHASPSNDLFRLLYSASSTSIGWEERECAIQFYHEELIKYLKLMNFPGKFPTLLEIQVESFRTDFYNVLITLFIIGLRFLNKSFDGGFLEVVTDKEPNANNSIQLYSHPECIRQMKNLLKIFDRRGYFDF